MELPTYPVSQLAQALKQTLNKEGAAVLTAPPGSGKTSLVPLLLLNEPWLAGKKILLLEPRRLAARTAAARMAQLLGETIGERVGYQIRFDRRIGPGTQIEVLTEGILTRRLHNEQELEQVGLIIFDEFHERSLHADLALTLALDYRQIQENLRILVMSATLDSQPLAALLGGVPVLVGKGRSYPVEIAYQSLATEQVDPPAIARSILQLLEAQQGDMLVFLPGVGEIRQVQKRLEAALAPQLNLVFALYGDLPPSQQDLILQPDSRGRRRIILATSVAETSLTIEGIGLVVDSGWSRQPLFQPATGLQQLTTVRVSQASATQRAGRAGRLGPGFCLRLWPEEQQHRLLPQQPPEIHRVDLSELVLELALWGVHEPSGLRWLDAPRDQAFRTAQELLQLLGALDASCRITELGRRLAALPLHPRLGRMLLFAQQSGQTAQACDLAALLTERDVLRGPSPPPSADMELRVELLHRWRHNQLRSHEQAAAGICQRVARISRQWQKLFDRSAKVSDDREAGVLLAAAYPDRIALRRSEHQPRYVLSSGRGANLHPGDPLLAYPLLVAPEVDGGQREGRIFIAQAVAQSALQHHFPELFAERQEVQWDAENGRVVAHCQVRLGALVMQQTPMAKVKPAHSVAAVHQGIRQLGLACMDWCAESRSWQERVLCLRSWQPEADWPDVSEQALLADLQWLEPYLVGVTKTEQLKRIKLLPVFQGMLSWKRQQALEQLAPVSLPVASGSKIKLRYQHEGAPILAVRLQELFGMAQTPTLCQGRQKVLLHLLSPARRPIQITDDLAGFWTRSYPEVKKELRGRYPKHYWPDDPLQAQATRGVKPRK